MASQAVGLDFLQNITNVGWGAESWLLIYLSHNTSNNSLTSSATASISISAPLSDTNFDDLAGAATPAETNTVSSNSGEFEVKSYTVTQDDIDNRKVSWSHHFIEDLTQDFGDFIGTVFMIKWTGQGPGEAVITVDVSNNSTTVTSAFFYLAKGVKKDMVLDQVVAALGVTSDTDGFSFDPLENFLNTIPGDNGEPQQWQFTIDLDNPRTNNP